MRSNDQQELLEAFSELRSVGQELADKINEWNEINIDEDNSVDSVIQDMSGESVMILYTERGYPEKVIVKMLRAIGFVANEESDDTVEPDCPAVKDVDEYLNNFLMECIEVANAYPYFVKKIELQPGNEQRKVEIRIIIPNDTDFRKLPYTNARKIMFMHFLKDIRERAQKYSMLDEALCFCEARKEFLLILKPLSRQKNH